MIREKINGEYVLVGNISMQVEQNAKSKPVIQDGLSEPSSLLPRDFTLSNVTWRVG